MEPIYLIFDHQGDLLNAWASEQTRIAVIKSIHSELVTDRDDPNFAKIVEVCVDEKTSRDVTDQTLLEAEQYGDWLDSRGRLPRESFFGGNTALLEMFERDRANNPALVKFDAMVASMRAGTPAHAEAAE